MAADSGNKAALMAEVPLACAHAGIHVGVAAVGSACIQFFGNLAHDGALRPGLRAAGVAGVVSTAAAALSGWDWPADVGWLH